MTFPKSITDATVKHSSSDQEITEAVLSLVNIMRQLRDPKDGCPWDLKQTHASISPYTIEEAYEVAEAIKNNDDTALCDELGDLLLQIVFQAQIASEAKTFGLADIANAINRKMIHRHPHIFDKENLKDADGVRTQWEDIKEREREAKGETRLLDGIATTLPAILRALKLQNRAARVGFDWPSPNLVIDKIREETAELEEEVNKANPDRKAISDELGDMFFVLVNLARKLDIDPEEALAGTNRKFIQRFEHIENMAKAQNQSLKDIALEQMEKWWQDAKHLT
ncbi:MAG: nucleoside triphosphate pyrophosphohydrolase [Proteobacteria bacterium]|nr:nucleoside triphosphate pyrophosphohydrolase [Pseudomonadota bacterium]